MSTHMLGKMMVVLALAAILVTSSACSVPAPWVDIGGTALATSTWYVTTGGDDSHDCLSVTTACRTIAAALAKATGIAVIQIGPGTFNELTTLPAPDLHATLTGDGVWLRSRVLTLRGTASGGTISTTLSGRWGLNAVSIDTSSDVVLEDMIIQNGSGATSRGLFVVGSGGGHTYATLRNAIVQGNGGSGVIVRGHASLTLENVQVINNGEYGVDNEGGQLTIQNSQISGNVKGGVFNIMSVTPGVAHISSTTVSGNSGVGIDNALDGEMTIDSSTVNDTQPGPGGASGYGIYNAGSLTLINATIGANAGSGIVNIGNLRMSFSTVAFNHTYGIYLDSGSLALLNDLVENNGVYDCSFLRSVTITVDWGGNDISDGSCSPVGPGGTRRSSPDPFLLPLADNGGPVQTMALQFGSSAINTSSPRSRASVYDPEYDSPVTDARGEPRPAPDGGVADVGAYEWQPPAGYFLTYATPTVEVTKPGIILITSPTPTSTPAAGLSFGQPVLSTDHFYSGGAGCGPLDLKLQVGVSNPEQVSSVVLFYHLEDKAGGGSTPWNEGVAMQPQGGGQYSYDLVSKTIPAFNSYPEAWLVYQFVATGAGGQVLLRSPELRDVTLSMCGKK